MELIPFGDTKLEVTKIGLGMAALGRPGYINLGHAEDLGKNYEVAAMQQHAAAMLNVAHQLGIRYVDAARSYGKAEDFLAYWFEQYRLPVTIGSKWGYTYTANWQINADKHEVKDHSIEVLNRQYQESIAILKDQLSIYHIHSATLESQVLDNQAVIQGLWDLKEQGLIIGFSASGPQQSAIIEKALSIKKGNQLLFGSVQATWNIFEQSAGQALEKAADLGLGVIIKEAVANGRLTDRTPDISSVNWEILSDLAEYYNCGVDALAIAYILHQPWVSTVLSGAANEKHLRSNIKALSIRLEPKDLLLLQKFQEAPTTYWNTRSALAWN